MSATGGSEAELRAALAQLPKAAGLPWYVTHDSAERGDGDTAYWLVLSPYEDDPSDALMLAATGNGEIGAEDEAIFAYAALAANAVPALLAELAALRTALAEAEARAALAPVADDYPAEVFRELWRVLGELRAATGRGGAVRPECHF